MKGTSAEDVAPEVTTVVVRCESHASVGAIEVEGGAALFSASARPCRAVLGWEPLRLKQNSAMLRCLIERSMAAASGCRISA